MTLANALFISFSASFFIFFTVIGLTMISFLPISSRQSGLSISSSFSTGSLPPCFARASAFVMPYSSLNSFGVMSARSASIVLNLPSLTLCFSSYSMSFVTRLPARSAFVSSLPLCFMSYSRSLVTRLPARSAFSSFLTVDLLSYISFFAILSLTTSYVFILFSLPVGYIGFIGFGIVVFSSPVMGLFSPTSSSSMYLGLLILKESLSLDLLDGEDFIFGPVYLGSNLSLPSERVPADLIAGSPTVGSILSFAYSSSVLNRPFILYLSTASAPTASSYFSKSL